MTARYAPGLQDLSMGTKVEASLSLPGDSNGTIAAGR
jgi:hypothetical protein